MNPTPSDLFVSIPLTNISIRYAQNNTDFIADQVFPNVPVDLPSGTYWEYSRGDWARIEAQPRAPGTESAGGGWRVTTGTYSTTVFAVHKDLDDQTVASAMNLFNLDRDSTEYVTRQLMLKREKDWVTRYFGTSIWSTDILGTASAGSVDATHYLQWDQAGSTPLEDVTSQKLTMGRLTGHRPNTLVMGPNVLQALQHNAEILDRIKYTERGVITEELLASFFGVDKVLIPWVVENTAHEGQTDSYSFMFGKSALLMYVAPNASMAAVSAGYTFSWNGYLGAGAMGNRITRFRMEHLKSDRIEGEMAYQMKVIAADLGVFFSGIVA